MLRVFLLSVVILFSFGLTACSGGGGGGDGESSLEGSVVNGPISEAVISLHYYSEADGLWREIEAEEANGNEPVLTDEDGHYVFWIGPDDLKVLPENPGQEHPGPLVVRSTGGFMNGVEAPDLAAAVPSTEGLRGGGGTVNQFISLGSSVAARALETKAEREGSIEVASAREINDRVEAELQVRFDQDPSDPTQPISLFTRRADQALGVDSAENGKDILNEYIDYLALNLSSASGELDGSMLSPSCLSSNAPSLCDVPADFLSLAELESRFPEGPGALVQGRVQFDKTQIENDGLDTAALTANILDATGQPVPDGTVVTFETTVGQLILSRERVETTDGLAWINISSLWPGAAEVTLSYDPDSDSASGPSNRLLQETATLVVVDAIADVDDIRAPRLVSAGALSNTEVLIAYSEPVRGGARGAENPARYRISGTGSASSGESEVIVIGAHLLLPERTNVLLTTLSQSNLEYNVVVTGVSDLAGNAISPGSAGTLSDQPTSFAFQGIGPSGDEIVDTDDDGLSDSDEQRGWLVRTVTGTGEVSVIEVTSDPRNADTDGDGVPDNEEYHGAFNPRSADTDGDTLTDDQEWNVIYSDPTNQDTDGDGTQDGFEFYSFRTSPILADTDGDQISDTDEVLGRNRDPRVADLARIGIAVGDVRLQIDERYTFQNEIGESEQRTNSSSTTLSSSDQITSASSDTQTHQQENSGGFRGGLGQGFDEIAVSPVPINIANRLYVEANGQFTTTNGTSKVASRESVNESQRVRQTSLDRTRTFSTTNTATREVFGASITAAVTIETLGDLAFTLQDVEIAVLQRSRTASGRYIPVATLVPERTLETGVESVFNLGPFNRERGPILFSSRSVFPNLVDQLMADPSGLRFEIANYNLLDEEGSSYTFSNQIARDRTGGIVIDVANGSPQRYLVATALQVNPREFGETALDGTTTLLSEPEMENNFVGGFESDGSPKGIPLDFALQDILGFKKASQKNCSYDPEDTASLAQCDGIVAGLDGFANSQALGDDVQRIPAGTTGLPVGAIVIGAGDNGRLDTPPGFADNADVVTGYETAATCSYDFSDSPDLGAVDFPLAGFTCSNDSDCNPTCPEDSDDCYPAGPFPPPLAGTCDGPEALYRVEGYRNGQAGFFWQVLSNNEIPAGAE